MEPERIEISRADFKKQFGHDPCPDVIGVCIYGNGIGGEPVLLTEYLFIDEIIPFGRDAQLRELRKLVSRGEAGGLP